MNREKQKAYWKRVSLDRDDMWINMPVCPVLKDGPGLSKTGWCRHCSQHYDLSQEQLPELLTEGGVK